MVNLRPKSKARAATPDLSDAALRKLTRAELQKLAMAYKIKANMKSESIIQQLSSFQVSKRTRPAEDDTKEGPSRKRLKRDVASKTIWSSPEDRVATPLDAQPNQDKTGQASAKDPQPPEAGPSAPRSISPARKAPTSRSYDENLFSGTESEMTEEEQPDFTIPVSSRSETPPLANVNDLKRCVTIMQEVSSQDVALLKQVTAVRETAAKLRRKARDIRDLVKAENGRRERMEAYFRYWQETDSTWDRTWLYGEKGAQDRKHMETPAGGQGPLRLATPVPGQKPALLPEELKRKREAIISKQEKEQRQLEALRNKEMRDKISLEDESNEREGVGPSFVNNVGTEVIHELSP